MRPITSSLQILARPVVITIASVTSALAASLPVLADVPNATCGQAAPMSIGATVNVPIGLASSDQDALPAPCKFGDSFVHSCWYRFDPTQPGLVTFTVDANTTGVPPVIVAYSGCSLQNYKDCSIGGDCTACATLLLEVAANAPVFIGVGAQFPTKDLPTTFLLSSSFVSGACGNDNSCCIQHRMPSCSDPTCCSAVCISDPSCCQTGWDQTCVTIAGDLCNNLCTDEDCDGNGEPDSQQFGPNSHLALRLTSSTSASSHWCPPLTGASGYFPDALLVSTGYEPMTSPRVIRLPYSGSTTAAGLMVVDTNTLLQSIDGGSPELTLGGRGLFVGPDDLPGPSGFASYDVMIDCSKSDVTVGSLIDLEQPTLDRSGFLSLGSGSALQAGTIFVVNGEFRANYGAQVGAGAILVEPEGAIRIGNAARVGYSNFAILRGQLALEDGTLDNADLPVRGEDGAVLSGAGQITGSVFWNGVVDPTGTLFVEGNLEFLQNADQPEPALDAKCILDLATYDRIVVGGTANLHGTLVIDATGYQVPLGVKIPLIIAPEFESDRFEAVQVRGLQPGIGAFIVSLGNPGEKAGAPTSGIGVLFVPLAQVLQFGDGSQSPLPAVPTDGVHGDFNGDGFDDLAISMTRGVEEPGDVVVFKNTTKGLAQDSIYTVGRDPRGIAAADFNGDERLDLVVANYVDDSIQVLRNTSVASIDFNQLEQVPIGNGPVDVAVGDFYQDALLVGTRADVVVALSDDASFKTAKNVDGNISGTTTTETPSSGGLPTSVGGGDVDNDRDDDVVGGSTGGTTIIPGGSSAASYTGGVIFIPTPNAVTNLRVADMTGDGIPEVLSSLKALEPRPGPPGGPIIYDSLSVVRAQGPGFSSALLDFWLDAQAPTTGDFDADGDLDLALVSRNSPTAPKLTRVIRNDSTPANTEFNLVAVLPELGEPDVLIAISIDGVGDDILSAEQVAQGDVAGRITLLRTPDPAIPGDLNRDGLVNAVDLALMFQYWGLPGIGDIDGSGAADGFDLTVLLSNWNR